MQALVIFESMFGNTHAVADAIAEGLRSTHDVTVSAVGEAPTEDLGGFDLVVVGGPTHVHGMSRPMSRDAASKVADDPEQHIVLDAGPNEPGVRGWLDALDHSVKAAAAFDTRLDGAPVLTGRASKAIARGIARHGAELVDEPESFLVDTENELCAGEQERARRWGADLGARRSAPRPSRLLRG